MKTVAGISCGFADNLLLRAADCTLKERRPLVLVPRETPLNVIHLKNMVTLAEAEQSFSLHHPDIIMLQRPSATSSTTSSAKSSTYSKLNTISTAGGKKTPYKKYPAPRSFSSGPVNHKAALAGVLIPLTPGMITLSRNPGVCRAVSAGRCPGPDERCILLFDQVINAKDVARKREKLKVFSW